jgi:hypothetical protein
MTELRAEAQRVLTPLADLAAPVAPGAQAPWDQLVRISDFVVGRAIDCGASLAYEGDFDGWRAVFARKQLGRAVLERMRKGATADPTTIAVDIVADLAGGNESLGRWLAELDAGGRAVVVREAVSFAVAVRHELQWPPAEGTRFGWKLLWDVPTRAVRLEATVDGYRRSTHELLVFATGTDDHHEIAWPALVAALGAGVTPARVMRIDVVSGDRWTVPVTDDVLDTGLTLAAAAVGAAMAARYTAPMTPTPGPWCPRCRGRDLCPVAQAVRHSPWQSPQVPRTG